MKWWVIVGIVVFVLVCIFARSIVAVVGAAERLSELLRDEDHD